MWEPWGSGVVYGPKRIENRSWRREVPEGGLVVAMHTSKRRMKHAEMMDVGRLWPELLAYHTRTPLGSVIGLVRFDAIVRPTEPPALGDPWTHPDSPWCWVVGDVWVFAYPVPCRGRQMLWRVPPEVMRAMRVQSGQMELL